MTLAANCGRMTGNSEGMGIWQGVDLSSSALPSILRNQCFARFMKNRDSNCF